MGIRGKMKLASIRHRFRTLCLLVPVGLKSARRTRRAVRTIRCGLQQRREIQMHVRRGSRELERARRVPEPIEVRNSEARAACAEQMQRARRGRDRVRAAKPDLRSRRRQSRRQHLLVLPSPACCSSRTACSAHLRYLAVAHRRSTRSVTTGPPLLRRRVSSQRSRARHRDWAANLPDLNRSIRPPVYCRQ